MEAEWMLKRIQLWRLIRAHPTWSVRQLADELGMSSSWVQVWKQRLCDADGNDLRPFMSRSRRRKTSPKRVSERLEAKIIHLRKTLTEQYHRIVGARNILYHLQEDVELKRIGEYIPKAASTVHEVLLRFNLIPRPAPHVHVPFESAMPLQVWEIDFTDIITARDPDSEKRQHQVEAFNVVDSGTSIALATTVNANFDARQALVAMIDVLDQVGMPQSIRFDRDPRFVASWTMDKFPSAFMRFLLCIGVTPDVCPPRRPDRKPYVERFIRSQKAERIYPLRPATVAQTQRVLDAYQSFYNLERPNQAVSCQNRPPSVALEQVPYLPRLPQQVNPDAWLEHYHRQGFRRRVRSNGTVTVDKHNYYIGKRYHGQRVLLVLDAPSQQFEIWCGDRLLKSKPIQGLFHGELPLEDYVEMMLQAAESEERRLRASRRRYQSTG